MIRVCQDCAAWRAWGSQRVSRGDGPVADEPVGQCRRQAPTVDPDSISGSNAAWPVVSHDDWCLAFSARPDAACATHHSLVARSGAAPSLPSNGDRAE